MDFVLGQQIDGVYDKKPIRMRAIELLPNERARFKDVVSSFTAEMSYAEVLASLVGNGVWTLRTDQAIYRVRLYERGQSVDDKMYHVMADDHQDAAAWLTGKSLIEGATVAQLVANVYGPTETRTRSFRVA